MHATILRMLAFFVLISIVQAQKYTTKGTDFWVSFMENDRRGILRLFFSADVQTAVTVEVPGLAPIMRNISPASTQSVDVSAAGTYNVYNTNTNGVARTAIHISSDNAISVYAFNTVSLSTDATLIIPTESLSSEYYTFCREYNAGDAWASEIMVIGIADSTQVEITPTTSIVNSSGLLVRTALTPFTVTLNRGDVYFAKGGNQNARQGGDLTGTRVRVVNGSGCSKIAVFSGHLRTPIPVNGGGGRDHLFEQMFPVSTWGSQFLVSPLAFARSSEIRIMAKYNGTTVNAGAYGVFTLSAQQYKVLPSVSGLLTVLADAPIAVAQYMKSANDNNGLGLNGYGDPMFMWIPPIEQTIDQITFNCFDPGTGSWSQDMYVNIILPTAALTRSSIDGQLLSAIPLFSGTFSPPRIIVRNMATLGGVSYTALALNVRVGNHTLICPDGCLANVYGMADADSYGFLAGASLSNLSTRIIVSGLNADSTVCPTQNVQLSGFANDSAQVVSWLWLLPNNIRKTGQTTNTLFSDTGTFKVRLVVGRNNGCLTDTVEANVKVRNKLKVSGADTSVCPNQLTYICASATNGTAPYKYAWSTLDNLRIVSGASQDTVRVISATPGTFRLIVRASDVNGCSGFDTVNVTVLTPPSIAPMSSQSLCVNDRKTIRALVSGGSGGYRYKWTPTKGIIGSDTTSDIVITIDSSATYSYSVSVTDSKGCTTSDSVKVFVLDGPHVDGGADVKIMCIGDTTAIGVGGTLTGGQAPFNTKWRRLTAGNANILDDTARQTSVYPTLSGLYEIAVTDANNCVGRDTIFVDVRLVPDANAGVDVAECYCEQQGKQIGVVSRCGVAPFQYTWSAIGGAPLTALSATNKVPVTVKVNENVSTTKRYSYVLTVVDGQGQSRLDTVTYTLYACPTVIAGTDTVLCGPAQPFRLQPKIIGVDEDGMTYSWSPPTYLSTTTSKSPIVTLPDEDLTITYTLRIVDKNSCPGSSSFTISTSKTLSVSATSTKLKPNCICRGDEIVLSAAQTGGTGPYTYSWTPPTDVANPNAPLTKATPLTNTIYKVTVTDARGCQHSDQVEICVQPVPNPRPGSDTTICEGGFAVRGDVATCGKAPFIYRWTPISGLSKSDTCCPTLRPTSTTTYTVEVIDAGSAKNSATITVEVNPKPKVTATTDKKDYCAGEPIILKGNATGRGGFQYTWFAGALKVSDKQTDTLNTIVQSSSFTLLVSDTNGCSNEETLDVNIRPNPIITMADAFMCPCSSVELKPDISGGTPGYTFLWTNPQGGLPTGLNATNTKNVIASPLQTTSYVLTVTDHDGFGCSSKVFVTVKVGDETSDAKLRVPDIVADPRDKNVSIPIILEGYPPFLRCPPTDVQFSFSFDENLFDPLPRVSKGTITRSIVTNGVRSIRVKITQQDLSGLKSGDVLTTITGAALLGDPGQTALMLTDVLWSCSSIQSPDTAGHLTLDSLCLKPDGRKRLLNFGRSAHIVSVVPNPTYGESYVTLQRFDGAGAILTVTSSLGEILWEQTWEASDKCTEEVITKSVQLRSSSGVYYLVLRAAGEVCSEQLVVIK